MSAHGLITLHSSFGPEETMDRLEAKVRTRGMTVFSRINHTEGAAAAGLPLRPTNLLIFGSAKAGTPLMQSVQTVGIDLPLKVLIWQDEVGKTYLSYNDLGFITRQHRIGEAVRPLIAAMSDVMKEMVEKSATAR
jgi:uncharacterized protein (DUF302 family)